ncbi:HlyD family secretion protein [Colwellia psychrerythraea]|uniref:Efflux transporter, RND family, MFP subunit n=1 Tax=Colwellia psychrerythraea TaxID=28229 RepID=A0A099K924_COLPS|nr:HlyD family efflux transporter periplasmic adaptor subunit [Colwellia psychrerythraea]KGJ86790.1 hypothetical protein GAB14E_4617 [Colwellia psychrerythraea]
MDIIKKGNKNNNKKYIYFIVVVMVALAWIIFSFASGTSIKRQDILIKTVELGTLNIEVEGYGKLRSSKQKLLTSRSKATVKEIVLKPGALVTHDSIILHLDNLDLEHEVTIAKQEYTRQLANLRKLKLIQIREVLTNDENLAIIQADYDAANMRMTAMGDLASEGIVSQLDYNDLKLQTKQLKKRIQIIKNSYSKLKLVHAESINIQAEEIEIAKSNYDKVQENYSRLTVKAGMEGILQELPVELGQSLAVGQQIALIGGTKDLVALIKVPQSDADKIRIGQKASIDTRKNIIESEVLRISPTVENGTVEIEIALTGNLPAHLRPEQDIDAVIYIEKIEEAYFIQRPSNVSSFSTAMLYKLSQDQLSAQITSIEFGVTSGLFIQVISGATRGDSLVLSNLSYLTDLPVIGLNN